MRRSAPLRGIFVARTQKIAMAASLSLVAMTWAAGALAANTNPVKIGVLAPTGKAIGKAIIGGAEVAANQINRNGGIDGRHVELIKYDTHGSTTTAVRLFKRLVSRDHVVAVTGIFTTEVADAVMPWAARMHVPFLLSGPSDPSVAKRIHDQYSQYKYVFQLSANDLQIAHAICDFSKSTLVDKLHYRTTVILVENAKWTEPYRKGLDKCLPKAGLKILGTIVTDPSTTNYASVYTKIEAMHPDVITAGFAHAGVRPVVQWHALRVPILFSGSSTPVMTGNFWETSNGAGQGVISQAMGASGAKLTPKTIPFLHAYAKLTGVATPSYTGYITNDAVHILKLAIERAKSTDADKLVAALEKTHYVGTWGTVVFQSRNDPYTHGVVYGRHGVTGVIMQWQNGKQVVLWPSYVATGTVLVPRYIKEARKSAN